MKTTRFTMLAMLATLAAAPGFTLNFAADVGKVLPPNLTINVPGYGLVEFSAVAGNAQVGTNFQTGGVPTPSLEFDPRETVQVNFLGAAVLNLDFDFINVSPGETMSVTGSGNVYSVQLSGSGNGAGLQEITFAAVPECTSSALGLLGAGLLACRRRR